MVHQAQINLSKTGISSFNDSLPQALGDWFLIGLVTGIRKSEWCQDRSHSSKKDITRNIDGSSSAFILSDFTFENKRGVRRDNSRSTYINDAEIVKIRWRFQKNNDNGQVLTYTANNTNPQFCPVRAAMRFIILLTQMNSRGSLVTHSVLEHVFFSTRPIKPLIL